MPRRKPPRFLQQQPGFPKILWLIAALLIITLIFILYQQTKPVELTFEGPDPIEQAKPWEPLIAQFEEINHHKIKIHIKNNDEKNSVNTDDLRARYVSGFLGKPHPSSKEKPQRHDLIYLDIIWVPEFAEKGWLMNLSEEFPEDFSKENLKKEFLSSEVEAGLYKGQLYRIPFRTDVGMLYYRKDLLKEAKELPETFEDLIKISQALQKQNKAKWGYLWQGGRYEGLVAMFVEVLKGYDSDGFWIENGQVGLRTEAARKAVEFLHNTISKWGISPLELTNSQEKYTRQLFLDEKAVFMRNWPSFWVNVNGPESNVAGNIDIKSMVHAEGKKSFACHGGWGFAIAANIAKHKKQAALKAINFFTSASSQSQFTLASGSVPSRKKLFSVPKIVAKYPHYPDLLDVIDNNLVERPRIPQYEKASCILQKYLNAALLKPTDQGYLSPEKAMNEAARYTELLLKGKEVNCEK